MAVFRWSPAELGKNLGFRPISGFSIDHWWTVACCQQFGGGV